MSALLHSAAMVAMGGFLLLRVEPLLAATALANTCSARLARWRAALIWASMLEISACWVEVSTFIILRSRSSFRLRRKSSSILSRRIAASRRSRRSFFS